MKLELPSLIIQEDETKSTSTAAGGVGKERMLLKNRELL